MWQPSGSRKTEQCAVLRSAAMASYVPKSVTNLCPSGAQVANTTGISYFKPEEVARMRPLQRVGDVIAQRFKVVEEAESSLKKAKTSEDKQQVWATLQHLELIPATDGGTMRRSEMKGAVKAQKAATSVLFGKK